MIVAMAAQSASVTTTTCTRIRYDPSAGSATRSHEDAPLGAALHVQIEGAAVDAVVVGSSAVEDALVVEDRRLEQVVDRIEGQAIGCADEHPWGSPSCGERRDVGRNAQRRSDRLVTLDEVAPGPGASVDVGPYGGNRNRDATFVVADLHVLRVPRTRRWERADPADLAKAPHRLRRWYLDGRLGCGPGRGRLGGGEHAGVGASGSVGTEVVGSGTSVPTELSTGRSTSAEQPAAKDTTAKPAAATMRRLAIMRPRPLLRPHRWWSTLAERPGHPSVSRRTDARWRRCRRPSPLTASRSGGAPR